MIKIRNKRIALLLVLAMLATMFVGIGTASAAEYVNINGSYTYVDAEDAQTAGAITVSDGDDFGVLAVMANIYAEVTLPDGVTFTTSGSDSFTSNGATTAALTTDIAADIDTLDIESDFTGSVTASVRVWGVTAAGATTFDVTENVVIAKVASGDTEVTAKAAELLTVGSNKAGAAITIKELSPGAFEEAAADDDIFLTVKATGVKFDTTNFTDAKIVETGIGVGAIVPATDFTGTDKTLHLNIDTVTTAINGKLVITPVFAVQPGASGDVVIEVSGDNIDTTEVTVATIGEGSIETTIKNDSKDTVRLGKIATLDDVEVTLDPSIKFNDEAYFSITLPAGLKFQDVVTPIADNSANLDFSGLYNSDKSAWFTFTADEAADVILSDFMVLADYNAVVGDLSVTFDGAVEGTYKIGNVKTAFEVTTTPFNVAGNTADFAGNKIVITEAAAGGLSVTDNNAVKTDNVPGAFDIELPMGVTFASAPKVEVTVGDLDLGTVEVVDDNTLRIQVAAASNMASTIEITELVYNIDNRASVGNITAKVGQEFNLNSNNKLASLVIGSTGNVAGASFVIGSSTYTMNGVTVNAVAPSYAANNRTYLPIRDMAHVLGISDSNILWDQASQTVTLNKNGVFVQLKLGSNVMVVNGISITMDVAVQASNNRTFLPAAFVAQAFGATATWDAATNAVTIK